MEINEVIKLWKSKKVEEVIFTFDCGGDSFNSSSTEVFGKDGKEIKCKELEDYFESEVFRKVRFYEASDGYYQGESGTVSITLNEDEDDFDYSKSAQAEYTEQHSSVLEIELPKRMVEFINDKISNINGSNDGYAQNFKRDFILSDKDETMLEELESIITKETGEFTPPDVDNVDDWFTFTTNSDNNEITELTIVDDKLQVCMSNSYTVYRDSFD